MTSQLPSYPVSTEFINCSLIEQSFLSVMVRVSYFFDERSIFFVAVVTPHAQRERGNVIDRGVHIYIYIYIYMFVDEKNI